MINMLGECQSRRNKIKCARRMTIKA